MVTYHWFRLDPPIVTCILWLSRGSTDLCAFQLQQPTLLSDISFWSTYIDSWSLDLSVSWTVLPAWSGISANYNLSWTFLPESDTLQANSHGPKSFFPLAWWVEMIFGVNGQQFEKQILLFNSRQICMPEYNYMPLKGNLIITRWQYHNTPLLVTSSHISSAPLCQTKAFLHQAETVCTIFTRLCHCNCTAMQLLALTVHQ